MLEYINNLDFEDYVNKDKLFDIFKTNSKIINSNLSKKMEKHEKISNFFIEYTKLDINSISKTLNNLEVKLSKIINHNDKINIKEIDNYISGLSKMILLCIFLIKVKKIVSKTLIDAHQYLSNNFLSNESNDIFSQKYYQFDEIFNSFFNNFNYQTKNNKNLDYSFQSNQKSNERISFGEMMKKNISFEQTAQNGDSTPKFIKSEKNNYDESNKKDEHKNNSKNNNEIDVISFDDSKYEKRASDSSAFTLQKLLPVSPNIHENNKNKTNNEKKSPKKQDINEKKILNKNKANNLIDKGNKITKRKSIYSTSSKNPVYFNYFNEKNNNFQSDKNLKKLYNGNSHESIKEEYMKKLNKYQGSKEVFVELFVLANELYKNNEITDEEKIILKQLIIKKSEKLIKIFNDNKDSRNNMIYAIKKVINKIIKNNIH